MARGTNKGRREEGGGGGGSEVEKGFPSSYGIYLPSSPSGSFGRGPNCDSLCELGRSELAASVEQSSSTGITNPQRVLKRLWMGHHGIHSMSSCPSMFLILNPLCPPPPVTALLLDAFKKEQFTNNQPLSLCTFISLSHEDTPVLLLLLSTVS